MSERCGLVSTPLKSKRSWSWVNLGWARLPVNRRSHEQYQYVRILRSMVKKTSQYSSLELCQLSGPCLDHTRRLPVIGIHHNFQHVELEHRQPRIDSSGQFVSGQEVKCKMLLRHTLLRKFGINNNYSQGPSRRAS